MNLATPYLNYDGEYAEKQQCGETNMKGTTIRGHTPTNLRNTVFCSSAVPEAFLHQRFFFHRPLFHNTGFTTAALRGFVQCWGMPVRGKPFSISPLFNNTGFGTAQLRDFA